MAVNNHHPLPSLNPTETFGNADETFAIKQEEEWDTKDNLDRIIDQVDMDVGDAQVAVKKEPSFSTREETTSRDSGQWKRNSGVMSSKGSSLSQDFGFIRSCLNVVLNVDTETRHELVRAMSSKIKYLEAITTGKNISKACIFQSNSTGHHYNSNEPNQVIGSHPGTIQDESTGTDQEEGSHTGALQGESTGTDQEEDVYYSGYTLKKSGLITKTSEGSLFCAVCRRTVNPVRSACNACSSYVSRTRSKFREMGVPLPTCGHKNFSGGSSCRSCRLRKYVKLSRMEPLPPTPRRSKPQPKVSRKARQVKKATPQKCMICEKMSPWFKGWRCSACFIFHMRLIARYVAGDDLPECDHDGYYAGVGCKGCRRIRLQREAASREPDLASRLPEMFSENKTHSD